jgi:hypothetical protein
MIKCQDVFTKTAGFITGNAGKSRCAFAPEPQVIRDETGDSGDEVTGQGDDQAE